MALPSLVHSPTNMVRSVRTGHRRKSSPNLAGWPPASDRQPWRPRGFTAHGPRLPKIFPANMVRSVRTGPRRKSSPELAGRPPAGGGPKANRGSREDSPHMATAGLRFFPQIWSDPSERGLDERVRRSSPDGRRPPVAGGAWAANRGGREDSPPMTLAGL